MLWAKANSGVKKDQLVPASLKKFRQYLAMCWFCVSALPFVHGEWAVHGRNVISISFVQLIKSVLMKAVPGSCMRDWEIPNEWIHFSSAAIVAWALVLKTGYAIRDREKASITNRHWELWLLGGWRGHLWSMSTVRKGMVSFCHSSRGTLFLCFGLGLLFWQVIWSAVIEQTQPNNPGH